MTNMVSRHIVVDYYVSEVSHDFVVYVSEEEERVARTVVQQDHMLSRPTSCQSA